MNRVTAIVGSESKIASFKSASKSIVSHKSTRSLTYTLVRGYRGNEMSASDLVDNLWNVFDRKADVASGIITGVADLFEPGEKRVNLMKAWQDLRVEVRYYIFLSLND